MWACLVSPDPHLHGSLSELTRTSALRAGARRREGWTATGRTERHSGTVIGTPPWLGRDQAWKCHSPSWAAKSSSDLTPCGHQPAGWIVVAEQHIRQGVAFLLAGVRHVGESPGRSVEPRSGRTETLGKSAPSMVLGFACFTRATSWGLRLLSSRPFRSTDSLPSLGGHPRPNDHCTWGVSTKTMATSDSAAGSTRRCCCCYPLCTALVRRTHLFRMPSSGVTV